MVRGCCGSKQCGVGGRGVTLPIASMPEGSNPQGEEQIIQEE
jgi:hypothetical protein